VAEGLENNGISFKVQKGKNKFATTLSVGVNPVGVYQYDADTGRSVAEVYPEFKGKGLGKLLVLHAIYTAAKLGLDFQEDESRTSEYDNVLDSLSSNGYIVDDDGYWYVTGEGEQYLQHSLKQGVAEDWNKVNHHDKTDGLSQKAVNAYRREHPGSKLKTAVTTKPSKLKAGSKAAKRRKSFCARMGGMKGAMKKPNGKPTRKALALRKWNCESVENMIDMILENMNHDKDNQAVPELKAALLTKKDQLQKASDDEVYDIIDTIMTRIAKSHGISGQKLHDMWVAEYDQVPDTWIMK
jgi:GNAT superfamily N-acetyltransferase